MTDDPGRASRRERVRGWGWRARAWAVHVLTASGITLAFLAATELCAPDTDPRRVLLLLTVAVVVDAIDGPLARAWDVKRWAPTIDGRTIDDIVDYITYTFLPLVLVWRMGWVPSPAGLFLFPALLASLFGFANTAAKDEAGGFFLGFPSYWNVVAYYAGLWATGAGLWVNGVAHLALAVLTMVPVRFIYPNLAPRPWRAWLLIGAVAWTALLIGMVPSYPHPPRWMVWLSLAYPVAYVLASWHLARRRSRPVA